MNDVVPHNKAAVVNVLSAVNRHFRSPTTSPIESSAAIGTRPKEIAAIAKVTPSIEANHTIQWIEWVSTILAPTSRKNANVSIVKIMIQKILKPAPNVATWDISGMIAAVSPDL